MNDKELLELAAKAAGIEIEFRDEKAWLGDVWWDPRTFNGDAFCLAVKLQMSVCVESDQTWIGINGKAPIIFENHDGKALAATRRAIVRAAAEISGGME